MKLMALPFAQLDPLAAYGLWKLRQDVFVVEQHCPYPDLDGRDLDPDTRHVLLMEDDQDSVVGCARVLDELLEEPVWRIGRVCLHPTARGRGLGDAVMEAALQICPGRDVVLDAQAALAEWYAGLGFEVTGAEFLEDGIPHVPMRLPLGQVPPTSRHL